MLVIGARSAFHHLDFTTTLLPPKRDSSRQHPRLHPYTSARSQRLHPPPPDTALPRRARIVLCPIARAPPCQPRERKHLRLSARKSNPSASPHYYLALEATPPGRPQRHWRVNPATQGTAENGYPWPIVRHPAPSKGATGWDAGSIACNYLHVQWSLVQSTQQH